MSYAASYLAGGIFTLSSTVISGRQLFGTSAEWRWCYGRLRQQCPEQRHHGGRESKTRRRPTGRPASSSRATLSCRCRSVRRGRRAVVCQLAAAARSRPSRACQAALFVIVSCWKRAWAGHRAVTRVRAIVRSSVGAGGQPLHARFCPCLPRTVSVHCTVPVRRGALRERPTQEAFPSSVR